MQILLDGRGACWNDIFNLRAGPKGGWRQIEVVVDSGACDAVANPKDFPGCDVEETEESRRGEYRHGAGGGPIQKVGSMKVEFVRNEGRRVKIRMKAGAVKNTLLPAARLDEAGFDVELGPGPGLRNPRAGQITPLTRKGGMHILFDC